MRQFGAVIVNRGHELAQLSLAGRSSTSWSEECARGAGLSPEDDTVDIAAAASRHEHLLVIDARWPLLLSESLERLVARHLESGAEVTFLTSGEAALEGASRICAGCFKASWLGDDEPVARLEDLAKRSVQRETSVAVAPLSDPGECLRLDDMAAVAEAEAILRQRINTRALSSGVRLVDPATAYIDADVTIERGATIHPNSHLRGRTRIARGCEIGPNAIIDDSIIGAGSRIAGATVERSEVEADVLIGLNSHVRDGAYICAGAHIGNFAEIKNSRIGERTRMHHFGYIGDADIGPDVNIGAGVITVNYDGVNKHRTTIGAGAFIGSDTMLVAPVSVGAGAATAAGAVVNKDVPEGMMALGVPARLRPRHKSDSRNER